MKRWIGCSVVTLSVATGAVVVGAWSVLSYHVLVREQIEVEARWSRIENVYHRRWSLAKRLADSARGVARDQAPVDSLAETCDRAAGIILSPEILNDPQRLDELVRLEASQRTFIAGTFDSIRSPGSGSFRALEEDLKATEEDLEVACDRFNESVTEYNRLIGRFPMSLFARLYGFRTKPSIDSSPGPLAPEDDPEGVDEN
jgi:LemA protein